MKTARLSIALSALIFAAACQNPVKTDGGEASDLATRPSDLKTIHDLAISKNDMAGAPEDLSAAPDLAGTDGGGPTQDMSAATDAGPADIAMSLDGATDGSAGTDGAVPDLAMLGDAAPADLMVGDMAVGDMAKLSPDLAGSDGGVVAAAFMVVRIGDGKAVLTSDAQAVFVEKYLLDGTPAGGPIAMPIAVNGMTQPLTLSGTATSEGSLSRSDDGKCVVLGGYGAVPGTASIAKTAVAGTNRIIGRVDGKNVVDTSTRLNAAFDGNNIRSAASSDCNDLWAAGATGGVYYTTLGALGGTLILDTPANSRVIHAVAGQLYLSSGIANYTNVHTVGVGLPKVAKQAVTALPAALPLAASPYGYALFDRDANVAGVDTLYVTDEKAGIFKYTFDGKTWTLAATWSGGLAGFRGLAGTIVGGNVTLIATTDETSANTVVTLIDDGKNMNPMAKLVLTAAANTVYRGVAIAP